MSAPILPTRWWEQRKCHVYVLADSVDRKERIPALLSRHGTKAAVIEPGAEAYAFAAKHAFEEQSVKRGVSFTLVDGPKGRGLTNDGQPVSLVFIWAGWP